MTNLPETSRVLRTAAWIWIGYLTALLAVEAPIHPRLPRLPIDLYYASNGLAALLFLGLAYWQGAHKRLGEAYLLVMILLISGAPILLHHTFVPRFPPGPLSNAEGMALRQMPVLFIGLALTAWCYELPQVLLFSLGTATLEMGIILLIGRMSANVIAVFFFITVVRTVSFIVIGAFSNQLMSLLRRQSESLRQANAQLTHYASALEHLTISRERNRIARELHDTLAHTLTGLSVTLETVKAYWTVDVDQARALLEQSLIATRNGLEETRRALKALRQMAESAAERINLDLELALPNPMPNLPPDVEQCLYRIAQEAVQNVVHHANAHRLALRLESEAGHWKLTVQDDGLGFDPRQNSAAGHFGLAGMKERAALAGGKLTIDSQKGKGTKIILEI